MQDQPEPVVPERIGEGARIGHDRTWTVPGKSNKLGPHREVGPQLPCALQRQAGVMFSACGPFWP